MQLPMVFILDLDRTIIGDCKYQSMRYSIQNLNKKTKGGISIPAAYKQGSKLIRPHFEYFINTMKSQFTWVEFFVYTMSEKNWGTQEIKWIEESLDINISRPIFTRDDCLYDSVSGNYYKSMTKILPKIWKTLSHKATLTPDVKKAIIKKRIMIIDDSSVYKDFNDHLLITPAYNYIAFEDILEGISHINKNLLHSLANKDLVCPSIIQDTDDVIKRMSHRYTWLSQRCNQTIANNCKYENDQFWKRLTNLIVKNKIQAFTPGVIKQLQDFIW